MIGDVWFASGQSNMEHPISGWEWIPHSEIANAEVELKDCDYHEIRLFDVPLYPSPEPLENLQGGKWEMVDKASLAPFSATAWFFAKKLHQELDIPIGIIHSSWGGTSILTWTNDATLEDFKDSLGLMEFIENYNPRNWEQKIKASIENNRIRRNKLSYPDPGIQGQRGRATVHGSPEMFGIKDNTGNFSLSLANIWKIKENLEPIPPARPMYVNHPGFLFNGMVAPIIPYGIKGFIWDQGSSDAGRPQLYAQLFRRLIKDWRNYWNKEKLPFLFVQNTGTHTSHDFEKRSFVRSHLREAQEKALDLPETAMVVSIDIGDPHDVHPKNKQEFGRRLALQALEKVYGKNIEADGPFYGSHEVKGDTVIVKINDAAQQLVLKCAGVKCGFELAGASGEFFPAQVVLKDNALQVYSENITRPRAIRYSWGEYPIAGVYNKEGLPMGPFRAEI